MFGRSLLWTIESMVASVETTVVVGVISTISYFAFGLTTFGSAILFQSFWYFFSLFLTDVGNIVEAIEYITLGALGSFSLQAVLLRREIQWRMVLAMSCGNIPGVLLGVRTLLMHGSNPWLKRGLGIFFFLIWGFKLFDKRRNTAYTSRDIEEGEATAERSEPVVFDSIKNIGKLWLAAFLGGYCAGLFGTGGPPLMIYLAFHRGIPKNHWRASSSLSSAIYQPVRLVAVFVGSGSFSLGNWSIYVIAVVASLVGLATANLPFFSKRVDQILFHKILNGLLLVSSLLLSTSGIPGVSSVVGVVVVVLCVGGGLCAYGHGKSQKRRNKAREKMIERTNGCAGEDDDEKQNELKAQI